jgi:drug/metabolite transporter (DMT)-like permease
MSDRKSISRNAFIMMIAWLSISSSSVLVLLSGVSALQAAFWRLFLSLPLIYSLSLILDGRIPRFSFSFLKFIAGASLGLHLIVWMESLFYIPVALSTVLVVLYPLISMQVEHWMLGEKASWKEFLGLLIAFSGIILVLKPGIQYSRDALFGSMLALSGAFLASIYFLSGHRIMMKEKQLADYVLPTYTVATIVVFAVGIFSNDFLEIFPASSWLYLFLLAIIPMIGGHTLMNYLIKDLKTSTVTSVALGEPVGATILAHMILGQPLSSSIMTGVLLVFTGLFLAVGEGFGETYK